MSAPIDDLLYGGDDSGDESDDMNVAAVPMPAFGSAPLLPPGATPLSAPLAATGAPSSAAVSAPAHILNSTLPLAPPPSSSTGTASAIRPPPHLGASSSSTTAAATTPATATAAPASTTPSAATLSTATTTAPKQQAPASGQQWFQQMFALLRQMLPPEQYASFYTEMSNGNGNDIKSIVDIVKRIAGDAMFAIVIQKLNLTQSFPLAAALTPTAQATTQMKSEPLGSVTLPASTPASSTASASALTPLAMPLTTTPLAATTLSPPAAVATTTQRPTLVVAPPAATAMPPPVALVAATPTVKPEPSPSIASSAVPSSTTASPSSSSFSAAAAASKNEQQLEKIEFAKKLLSHAATCVLSPGVCQVTKCDDVRRVFKHSVSCGGAGSCSHCEQLKGLVKYHAKECATPANDHCTIPFCDALRRAFLAAAAAQAAKAKATPLLSTKLHVTSDDDDDNTPLSSAVVPNKTKKHTPKAKSPKVSPTVRTTPVLTTAAAKKKAAAAAATAAKTAAAAAAPTTTTPATTTDAAKPAAANAAASATMNMTVEYGRLLQLILHVQQCTATACPVGDECTEAKSLMRVINAADAPPRAKTFRQVYSHYKVCLQKNNTENCPMCKIGLAPIVIPAQRDDDDNDDETSSQPSPSSAAAASATTTSPPTASGSTKRTSSSSVTPSPRSPSKKQRTSGNNSRVKAAPTLPDPATAAADHDLMQATIGDIRKEADVLTHTGMDVSAERRTMLDGSGGGRRRSNSKSSGSSSAAAAASAAAATAAANRTNHTNEQLACMKETWQANDLFDTATLEKTMAAIAKRHGVQLGAQAPDALAYALHAYLKQVVEELVASAKQRCDSAATAFEQYQQASDLADDVNDDSGGMKHKRHVTSTDILRVSCEASFQRVRQDDLALRATLLDDAKREEAVEKERAKKRKKVDRSKQNQEERDEAEMDMDELAVKDLKDRLLQEDKDGVVRVDGRVNESIAPSSVGYGGRRTLDHQVTLDDATFWLERQKPYVRAKLFVRAEAARIVTKSLL